MALALLSFVKVPNEISQLGKVYRPQQLDCRNYSTFDGERDFVLDIYASPEGTTPYGGPDQSHKVRIPKDAVVPRTVTLDAELTEYVGVKARLDACLHVEGAAPAYDLNDPKWKTVGNVKVVS